MMLISNWQLRTTFIHSSCSALLITNNESLLPLLFSVCSSHWNSQFCLPRPLRHYLVGAPKKLGTWNRNELRVGWNSAKTLLKVKVLGCFLKPDTVRKCGFPSLTQISPENCQIETEIARGGPILPVLSKYGDRNRHMAALLKQTKLADENKLVSFTEEHVCR